MNAVGIVFWISLTVSSLLVAGACLRARGGKLPLVSILLLAVAGVAYYFTFGTSSGLESKGEQSSWPAMVVLFICTLAGMASNYLFTYFIKPQRAREKFDFGYFVAPMFASPIIYAPLWEAFQNAGVSLTNLKYAAFFVAFQNGFFWKDCLDNFRRRRS